MPVISHSLRLVYFDVPKVGCTTLKVLFWELEHGRIFRTSRWVQLLRRAKLNVRAPAGNIHYTPGYQTWSFARCQREFTMPEGYSRLTVLRDPIDRVFSAWKSKARPGVFSARDEVEDLRNEGLSESPSFGEFLDNYEDYRRVSRPVRIHTQPYAWHLGPDVMAYDHVFRLENVDELRTFLNSLLGREVELPQRNSTTLENRNTRVGRNQLDRLVEITAPEYSWAAGIYDLETGLAKLRHKADLRSPGT